MQALLDATDLPIEVVAVGADRENIEGLKRAERAGVPHFAVKLRDHADRAAWDAALTEAVASHEPDLVVSAGFMKIIGPRFLARFGGRMINTHPALLPAFPGAHGVRDALDYGVRVTGSTVHLVDAGVDTGPILAQEAVVVEPGDTEETLHERIKVVERRLLVETVGRLAREGCTVNGRKVSIP
ncbi:phosphoribosylglycinamide formyltransferase-1 [Lentzea aerocolonigenes]|nr:phosphoribosylglycinamide formyltransferase-1 [Lentzea aerocolonigenes]